MKNFQKKVNFSVLEKDYHDFKLHYNEQSVEEVLIQRAAKTTIPIVYDRGSFDSFLNADKALNEFLFVTRRGFDLEKKNNDVIQLFCS